MMKYSKGKNIIIFILMLVLIAGCCFTAGFGWGKTKSGAAENIILGLDLKGGVSITYKVKDGQEYTKEDFEDTKYKLSLRVSDYSTEAEVYQEGDDRITVDVPGADNAEEVLEEIGKPGSLYFATLVSEEDPLEEGEKSVKALDFYGQEQEYKIWVSGDQVDDAVARTQVDDNNREEVVSLTFNDAGAKAFKEATTEYLNDVIYIIYDGEILSAPKVQSVIDNGMGVINGQESYEEAEKLASNIRIGGLSLELEEISSKVVGAKLGNDAVKTSLQAAFVGILLVMLFMIIVYRIPGLASAIALVMYTAAELMVLNAFDLTLTLPGIAGIILSIGMAVDANVIIFARIKEELALGKSVDSAITTGFKKATSAIVDGNVTTFIAALVLMWKGTGPVQGFAQTLAIGIILSMFTAMVVTRLLVTCFYKMGFKSTKFYGVQKERKTIDFLKRKVVFFVLSIVLIVSGIASMFVFNSKGDGYMNLSIEFKGGISTTVDFDKEYSIDDFNDKIKPELAEALGTNDIQGQKIKGSNKLVIKTPYISDTDKRAAMKDVLADFGALEDSYEESNISASVGKEMKQDAIIAVILATICMLIYIWFRFKNLRFASSAVLALVHDVVIVIGFYAISRITVGTTFIACMLTIVGYSINATIVIFDRIRENMAADSKKDIKEIVNASITQTLTRSIYTSITTFITIFVLYILGVTAIKEFALPIMVGIVCGGYSSVCITGALWYVMSKKSFNKSKAKK